MKNGYYINNAIFCLLARKWDKYMNEKMLGEVLQTYKQQKSDTQRPMQSASNANPFWNSEKTVTKQFFL
jgi:hypothetical protein